jgi:uncharacterized membrane protein
VKTAIASFKRPGPLRNHHHHMNIIAAVALAIFLFLNGIAHFARPAYVRTLVPTWVGHARLLVFVAGAALILDGVLLLTRAGRMAGGWVAAVMISAFVVAHLDALARAVTERPRQASRLVSAAAKVSLNLGYIGWAVAVAVNAR